jgi:hypothetical protein
LRCGLLATEVKVQIPPLLEFFQLLYILSPVYPDTETKTMATKKAAKKVAKKTKKKAAKKKR